MHPFFAYYLWLSAMMRAASGGPLEAQTITATRGSEEEGASCKTIVVPGLVIPAIGQCLVTDVTSARLPDRFLDLLGELHWAEAA